MSQTQTIHINFTGGILSPGYLKSVLEAAAAARVTQVRFGLRQQLILDVPGNHFAKFEAECKLRLISFYRKKETPPNIVSSYAATGIFSHENWLREGVYKDLFDLFDYTPSLKINICDHSQSLVPFFTGHINWISSANQHYWHLYIRFPKTQTVYRVPELIYTNDLVLVSKRIEQILLKENLRDGQLLFQKLRSSLNYISRPIEQELSTPRFSLPYYEGFNRHDGQYWLGIYRRNELFPLPFLLQLCELCLQSKIGQFYTTPWKSIIIKGIEEFQRPLWDNILGLHRINVRHAANELAWQIEDNNEEGLQVKRQVIRYFDKEDVRTYGLCFAVQIYPHSGMSGSVIIKKQAVKNPDKLRTLDRYEIHYTEGFNPNSFETVLFRQNVKKEELGVYLVSVCKLFYEEAIRHQTIFVRQEKLLEENKITPPASKIVHQCSQCGTVYDASMGDSELGIAAGTMFEELPNDYQCPLCEGGKEEYIEVEEPSLHSGS